MAQWGATDAAGMSPIWTPGQFHKKISRTNANLMYGNTTANSTGSGEYVGVFAADSTVVGSNAATSNGVSGVTVDTQGGGAQVRPTVTITAAPDDTGINATATATAALISATVNASSIGVSTANGYAPADNLTFTGDTGTEPVVNVVTTQVGWANVGGGASAGSGYVNGDIITLNNGGVGTQAAFIANTNGTGNLSGSFVISIPGAYTTNPTLLTNAATSNTSGIGSGGKVNIVMVPNQLAVKTQGGLTVFGSTNAIPSSGGSGVHVKIVGNYGVNNTITMSNTGIDFDQEPLVVFGGTGLTGATGHANLALHGVEKGITHTGWNLRVQGSGGRAGRVHYETLVAGGITGGINTQLP